MTQDADSLLAGCGLPQAWAGERQWRVLATGFGQGLNFLLTWAAWRADPQRPQQLHYVACQTWPVSAQDLLRATPAQPELQALAAQLARQLWGLTPGVHRLLLDGGRVQLSLYIGDAQSLLRQQRPQADSVYLDGYLLWNLETIKTVARCCRTGTRLAASSVASDMRQKFQQWLQQCGFVLEKFPDADIQINQLQARFAPHWQPRRAPPALPEVAFFTHQRQAAHGAQPPQAVIVGAGLAGASVAYSLARRGWQVTVLDAAQSPAAGASGLPAGLFAPHVSADDNLQSRLSRAGLRLLLQQLEHLGADAKGQWWDHCGVLEQRPQAPTTHAKNTAKNTDNNTAAQDWSRPATPAQLHASGQAAASAALWHMAAGWVSPSAWVRRLLAQPGIRWQGNSPVASVRAVPAPATDSPAERQQWQVLDAHGQRLGQGDLVVLCASLASAPLAGLDWPLQALRGQVSWGWRQVGDAPQGWPAQPVNGHGNLVPAVPMPGELAQQLGAQEGVADIWVMGSTFERDCTALPPRPEDIAAGHRSNYAKLQQLQPRLAQALQARFADAVCTSTPLQHWAGVRCAAPDRLPIVGPLPQTAPGLWVSSAMGARGLSLSMLCAELLAARLHDEPLPLDTALAKAISSERMGAGPL